MREYEVNTYKTSWGMHAICIKGIAAGQRKNPYKISDMMVLLLRHRWYTQKYNVVINVKKHDDLSHFLTNKAKYPVKHASVAWEYRESDDGSSYFIDVYDAVSQYFMCSVPLGARDVKSSIFEINLLLNTIGVNLTWFDYVDPDGLESADNNS